jgi:hypothetical protein
VISRSDAKSLGLKRYMTGDPCKVGHVSERLVSNGRCMECDRASKKKMWVSDVEGNRAKKRTSYRNDADANRLRASEYRKANAELVRARDRKRYAENREARAVRDRLYRQSNIDAIRARRAIYDSLNQHMLRYHESRRRARKRNAMPDWFGELDELVWREAADLVIRRRRATGIAWDADHMIPIAGRKACGLHVWNNCQVIPEKLNLFKNNKMFLTEPREWIQHL